VRRHATLAALVAFATLAGCAGAICRPATIVVAAKDTHVRLESEFLGLTTDHAGRVVERRRDVIVLEYWVRDQEGHWYRVAEAGGRHAAGGAPREVCRKC
jgi:hypothetical protein